MLPIGQCVVPITAVLSMLRRLEELILEIYTKTQLPASFATLKRMIPNPMLSPPMVISPRLPLYLIKKHLGNGLIPALWPRSRLRSTVHRGARQARLQNRNLHHGRDKCQQRIVPGRCKSQWHSKGFAALARRRSLLEW